MSFQAPISRRGACRIVVSALAAAGAVKAAPGDPVWNLDVTERAGLRRYGFPVHARLAEQRDIADRLRLVRNGKEQPAQFRRAVDPAGQPFVALDFNTSPGPLETEQYQVVMADRPAPASPPGKGMHIEREEGRLRVSNGSILSYVLPEDLRGFLTSVVNGKTEFLMGDSTGLCVRSAKTGAIQRVGGTDPGEARMQPSIVRDGPIAVGLRFEGLIRVPGTTPKHTVIEASFPNSKSWIEVNWEIEDPEGDIGAIGVDLRLRIEGAPTLVDLGAGSVVYSQLRRNDSIELEAEGGPPRTVPPRPWVVRKGPTPTQSIMAEAPGPNSPAAEGWAHVMDATRCTAAAVADFGRATRDRIVIDADGRLQLWRDFSRSGPNIPRRTRRLAFWLHFVPMPVQVGAATSPQAMLAPLTVVARTP